MAFLGGIEEFKARHRKEQMKKEIKKLVEDMNEQIEKNCQKIARRYGVSYSEVLELHTEYEKER